jgi:hypothetical protein
MPSPERKDSQDQGTKVSVIERVMKRVLEIGDCLEWQGHMGGRGTTPVISVNRVAVSIRRAILEERGVILTEGQRCTTKCNNPRCVNPDHIKVLTTKQFMSRAAKGRSATVEASRARKIAESHRKHSKITMEIAQQIRLDQRPGRLAAPEYGISKSLYDKIRRGESWRDFANPFFQLM